MADENQTNYLFEAFLWVKNEYKEGIKIYNQLLRDKAAVNEKNKED